MGEELENSILTFRLLFPTDLKHQPPYEQQYVYKDTERWYKRRLLVILHHQEVHLILPDLDGILLYRVKHMAARKNY